MTKASGKEVKVTDGVGSLTIFVSHCDARLTIDEALFLAQALVASAERSKAK